MRLKGIPALYDFTGGTEQTVPSGNGSYTIPRSGKTITYHETRAAMNYDYEVTGEFVTYRYTPAPRAVEPLVRRRTSHRRSRPPPLFLQATDEHGPEYGTGVRPPDHRI